MNDQLPADGDDAPPDETPGAAPEGFITAPEELGVAPDGPDGAAEGDMELYDLRVVVDRIDGRSVCGMRVGDRFDLEQSAHLRLPDGAHFCVYALAAVLPFLAAKQRDLAAGDWLAKDTLFACPDPEERLVMRVERTRRRRMNSADLT
ncbi:TIGR04076 family protein [Sphaerisporangium sp. NPDC005288]|uniref:TIGR04076 family protein n=1 Tax=unclassified Sphaerisporangium TaxID=2630420 RepID=UPI0033B31E2C